MVESPLKRVENNVGNGAFSSLSTVFPKVLCCSKNKSLFGKELKFTSHFSIACIGRHVTLLKKFYNICTPLDYEVF